MHIGQRIKEVMDEQGRSVIWLAKQLDCERTNVYNVFSRKDISTKLIDSIGLILKHDFYKELSEDFKKRKKQR